MPCSFGWRRNGEVAGVAFALATLSAAALAGEQAVNGGFAGGTSGWWATANLTMEVRSGRLCVDVPGGLANSWDAIIGQDGITLAEGENYRFSFGVSGDPQGSVRALVQMPVEPWTAYLTVYGEANPESELYEAGFAASVARADAQIAFQVGGFSKPWTFCLDDVSLRRAVEPAAYRAKSGPDIRVNQLGYLPDGPKRATIVSGSSSPLTFEIVDSAGKVVFSGKSEPRGFDTTAGFSVHVADFSPLNASGAGFTLHAKNQQSYPFAIRSGLYRELRPDALGYFYLARSGIDIDAALVGEAYSRPAGHVSTPGDSARNKGDRDVPCQPARVSRRVYGEPWTCDYTLSPVGGWYDAGDHGKYVVNGGISVSQLMTAYEWSEMLGEGAAAAVGDGSLPVPEKGNGIPDILDEARWELDFFRRMIVPQGEPLAGMVHHKIHDNEWTGTPLLPHLSGKKRELHRPSTAATLNAAAAFAQAARVLRRYDAAYAEILLAEAQSAWAAARRHPTLFATPEDGRSGGGPYDDNDVDDEFYWAAAELFITTGDREYLDFLKASRLWNGDVFNRRGFDWKDVGPYARMQLALHADTLPYGDGAMIRRSIIEHADGLLARLQRNPFGHAYVPENGFYDWGSNHLVIQNGILLAGAHEVTGEPAYRAAAIETIDYILGRNALNISYVTGYGTVFAENQHSRWFANQVDPDLPNPPRGALAGGPNSGIQDPVAQRLFGGNGCAAQTCYVDDIESWSTNEITINWNAALAHFAIWLAAQ